MFFPVVIALYWILPHRLRWILLLVSSYYFYMSWNVKYVVLILFTTVVSYVAALLMERTEEKRRRKQILAFTLIACLGVLFLFKYFNLFSEAFAALISAFVRPVAPLTLKFLLPVGISYYTFQTLAYVIDVYRGDVKAEPHFGYYATFISYFPQLVAGPIERTDKLLPQIKARHVFDEANALYGAKLMLWGFFKKLVIADNLAPYVDRVFGDVYANSGFSFLLVLAFGFLQVYCDFSGYSDIARGTAKWMGIELMENFTSPLFSSSLREFWARWHISLSTWFRDYVYIPLGGSRHGKLRRDLNLLATFLLCGLWHGADWTFVLWGGFHGLGQIVEEIPLLRQKKTEGKVLKALRTLGVFFFFVISIIFFRAANLHEMAYVFANLLTGITQPVHYLWKGFADIALYKEVLLGYVVLFFAPLILFDYLAYQHGKNGVEVLDEKNKALQWAFWLLIGLVTVFFAPKGVPENFVYFQF